MTRKTDKGLPRYEDYRDSDTFVLSGSEDLVPKFKTNDSGVVIVDSSGKATIDDTERDGFVIRQYAKMTVRLIIYGKIGFSDRQV